MIFNMIGGGGISASGNADLNFSVARYNSADVLPESAEENTVAIITEHEITNWFFSSSEPSMPEEGETPVWVGVGISSNAAFNALKENGIFVYPISAKQYINGDWMPVDIQVYQNGEWKLLELTLYRNGVFNTEVFGDPVFVNITPASGVQSDGTIKLYRNQELKTSIAVDASPYSIFQYDIVSYNDGRPEVKAIDEYGSVLATTNQVTGGIQTVTLDLSAINKPIFINMLIWGNSDSDNINIDNLKFIP